MYKILLGILLIVVVPTGFVWLIAGLAGSAMEFIKFHREKKNRSKR